MASRQRKSEELATKALIGLYGYQKRWITDEARFKLMVKSRQTGLSFGTTLRHVRKRIAQKGTTVIISASDRQSREEIEYSKMHARALEEVFEEDEIEFKGTDDKAQMVTFKHNGSRIIGLPANPETCRGFVGDVVLQEFAFHRDAKKIYRAALAIASRGYQVEVVSTPNQQEGEYWEICKAAGVPAMGGSEVCQWTKGIWSVHWLDIFTAVKEGCPIDIEAMRAACNDEDSWLQEYCCVFLADAASYIAMELIVAVEHSDATLDFDLDQLSGRDLYLGMDIGRKKDRTVIWLLEKVGDVFWTRLVWTLERTPFAKQLEMVGLLLPYVRRGCIDATGIGAMLAEEAVRKFGSKIEAVEFNIANKEKMAGVVKKTVEERLCRIPESPALRRSMNAVKRYQSPTGHFRFDAARTDAGHADEFWALALALSAGSGTAPAALGIADVEVGVRSARTSSEKLSGGRERVSLGVKDRTRRLW